VEEEEVEEVVMKVVKGVEVMVGAHLVADLEVY
jgi:hypothetical protein